MSVGSVKPGSPVKNRNDRLSEAVGRYDSPLNWTLRFLSDEAMVADSLCRLLLVFHPCSGPAIRAIPIGTRDRTDAKPDHG